MAVYTALSAEDMCFGLAPFGLGPPTRIEPVAAGIENSTYFVTFGHEPNRAEYVLTLGESITAQDMKFVARLITALGQKGMPVPAPIVARNGASVVYVAEKPAVLVPKAAGSPPAQPSTLQCRAIGSALAKLHRVTLSLAMTHASHKSLEWVAYTGRALLPHVTGRSHHLLHSSLADLERFVSTNNILPRAIIHGDLFRDNTLFVGERLTAIIDFFSAGTGYLLFDLAVAVNDWCTTDEGHFIPEKLNALLADYCAIRPLTPGEQDCWGAMLVIAALRFWVSRLADRISPSPTRPAQHTKDPQQYEKLLTHHRAQLPGLNFPFE